MTKTINLVSAGGVIYHQGQVLTITHLSGDCIEFPKGTIELGETVRAAAQREVLEETGYKTTIMQSLGFVSFEYDQKNGRRYHKTVHYYLMRLISDEPPRPNREAGEQFENLWLSPFQAATRLTFDEARDILARAMAAIDQIK